MSYTYPRSMNSFSATRRRRKWPWIVGGVVVTLAVLVALIVSLKVYTPVAQVTAFFGGDQRFLDGVHATVGTTYANVETIRVGHAVCDELRQGVADPFALFGIALGAGMNGEDFGAVARQAVTHLCWDQAEYATALIERMTGQEGPVPYEGE